MSVILNRYLISLLWVVSFFLPGFEAKGQVIIRKDLKIKSEFLQKEVSMNIILPEEYYTEKRDYPVIYLLHGNAGNHTNWLSPGEIDGLIDSLTNAGELCECIFVLPDAGNSYYINNYDGSIRYEDFFIGELLPWVDSVFRTQANRSARALMGLSMGGYGSIIQALRHPDKFGTVVALSSSVRNDEMLTALPQKRYEVLFSSVYGPQLTGAERISHHWMLHSPYYLSVEEFRGINWYIACGLSDFLLPASQAFHGLLEDKGVAHKFVLIPGKHNWSYWRSSAVPGLQYISNKVCSGP